MKHVFRRTAAVLVLVLSTAAAAQAAGRPAPAERPGFLSAAWTWIVLHTLPATPPGRTAVVEKAGCEMDPNGLLRCSPLAPAPNDAGCEMDPDGAR